MSARASRPRRRGWGRVRGPLAMRAGAPAPAFPVLTSRRRGARRPDSNGDEYRDVEVFNRDFTLMAEYGMNAVRIRRLPGGPGACRRTPP